MQFGFTLKPEHTVERTLALTRQAEAAGFDYGWLFDSHVLWRDPYPLLTLMAGATERMRLGTCVTNPGTREPTVTASALATLDEITGGRMDLGIGRGDSARRVLGKPPITHGHTRGGDPGHPGPRRGPHGRLRGHRAPASRGPSGWTLPVWVAGYGPMALAMTGRVADGLILQLADPDLIRWFVGQVREAATAAGRDPARSGSRPRRRPTSAARPRPRADALVPGARHQPRRRSRQQVPARAAAASLTGYVRTARATTTTTTPRSARRTPPSSGRGDRPVLRPRDGRRAHREAARARDAGVDQFNLYLMNGDEEAQLEATAATSSRPSRLRTTSEPRRLVRRSRRGLRRRRCGDARSTDRVRATWRLVCDDCDVATIRARRRRHGRDGGPASDQLEAISPRLAIARAA